MCIYLFFIGIWENIIINIGNQSFITWRRHAYSPLESEGAFANSDIGLLSCAGCALRCILYKSKSWQFYAYKRWCPLHLFPTQISLSTSVKFAFQMPIKKCSGNLHKQHSLPLPLWLAISKMMKFVLLEWIFSAISLFCVLDSYLFGWI